MSIRASFLRGAAILAVAPWVATAQSSAAFSRPVLGYVYDASRGTVDVIAGVPGAAGLEAAFASKDGGLTISPRGSFGLSSASGLSISDWTSGAVVARVLTGADETPSQLAFSPSGRSAVAIFRGSGKVRVWSGLPAAPKLEVELDASLPDTVDSLAVADDARTAALLSSGKLMRVGGDGTLLVVDPDATYSAMAFRPGTRDLAVTDSDNSRVLLFRDFGNGSNSTVVASDVADPAAVSFAADGNTLVVAAHGTGSIVAIDVRSGNSVRLNCDCRPESFNPVQGNAVFRLGDSVKGNLSLFDGDGDTPRIVLVAAPVAGGVQ